MTLRAVIVDDEPLALSLLGAILSEIDGVEILARCSSGQDAVDAVSKYNPDILFLDIQMPEMTGFDVVAAIQNDIMPMVVFTTAYAEYAVDAFKVQALDYILKPLEDRAIFNTVSRAVTAKQANQLQRSKPEMLMALLDISQNSGAANTLIVKDNDRISFLEKDQIEWFEAAGDYVCIHMGGKVRMIRGTLKGIETRLGEPNFRRIHRSTIVNMLYISDIIPIAKGEAHAVMRDGSRLKVSRQYGKAFKALFS